jgi:predicted aspartyl protease
MFDQAMTEAGEQCRMGNVRSCVLVGEFAAVYEPCRQGDAIACQHALITFSRNGCLTGFAEGCRIATAVSQAPPPKSSTTVAVAGSATTKHIPLTRTPGGSLVVAASINGSAPIRFTLDSGAETLALPSSMARQLLQQGVITKAEFLGTGASLLADGRQTPNLRFRLRSVNLGGIVVQNIICVVVEGDGDALLGQTVLSKLRSWKIDNQRQTLDIS